MDERSIIVVPAANEYSRKGLLEMSSVEDILAREEEMQREHNRQIRLARTAVKQIPHHCSSPDPCVYLGFCGNLGYCADGHMKSEEDCVRLWNGEIHRAKMRIVVDSYSALIKMVPNQKEEA
jgi:hypothetical protein